MHHERVGMVIEDECPYCNGNFSRFHELGCGVRHRAQGMVVNRVHLARVIAHHSLGRT